MLASCQKRRVPMGMQRRSRIRMIYSHTNKQKRLGPEEKTSFIDEVGAGIGRVLASGPR